MVKYLQLAVAATVGAAQVEVAPMHRGKLQWRCARTKALQSARQKHELVYFYFGSNFGCRLNQFLRFKYRTYIRLSGHISTLDRDANMEKTVSSHLFAHAHILNTLLSHLTHLWLALGQQTGTIPMRRSTSFYNKNPQASSNCIPLTIEVPSAI